MSAMEENNTVNCEGRIWCWGPWRVGYLFKIKASGKDWVMKLRLSVRKIANRLP